MNPREAGFLLLTSHLGDDTRRVLTVPQLRELASRVMSMEKPKEDRHLQQQDLVALGYDRIMAQRILRLLEGKEQLIRYLCRAKLQDCTFITRVSSGYPASVRHKLGLDAPGCLWAKGDLSILEKPAVSLVGSRELKAENRRFAQQVGRQAARLGYVLVSGNARGADRTAQDACLEQGGQVISVVADQLCRKPLQRNILWLSEEVFDGAFTAQRAISRNRIIHCLGSAVFVAQCTLRQGGTWDGTCKNLRNGWNRVFCYADATAAAEELKMRGARTVGTKDLDNLKSLLCEPGQIQMEEFYEQS